MAYKDRDVPHACMLCGGKSMRAWIKAPSIKPDLGDFSSENNGKGRFNPQLKKHFRHVNDVAAEAQKLGYDYSKA